MNDGPLLHSSDKLGLIWCSVKSKGSYDGIVTFFIRSSLVTTLLLTFSFRNFHFKKSCYPIQDGLFGATHGWGGGAKRTPLPKICHTYPTMMKLGNCTLRKEVPKNTWITWHKPWVLLTSAFLHWKSADFALSRNTDIDCILIHSFYLF